METSRSDTHRLELTLDERLREPASARLFSAGALGVWERGSTLVAWFTARPDRLGGGLDAIARWSREPDRDWQETWKAGIEPVRAGRTVVVPSWLADEHAAADDDLVVVLDPGRAFGTGHHATTAMCLELLDELDLATGLDGRRVADVGCGSGILAIAVAARGARVIAVDVDPAAVEVTIANARTNGVTIDVRHGGVEMLDSGADIVVANLVTDLVAELAEPLVAATGSHLVVSGITAGRRRRALDPLRDAGLTVAVERERDGWVAARLVRDRRAAGVGVARARPDRRG